MAGYNQIKTRLAVMNFLEFAIWGSYLVSMGIYLGSVGLGEDIFWFYTVQGLVSLFMPGVIGIIADRWLPAQKMLSLCHGLAGIFMLLAGFYCMHTGADVGFGPLFTFYTLSVAFYMPTIGLANSVAFNALNRANLDTVKHFPPIRVLGTVGFICAELFAQCRFNSELTCLSRHIFGMASRSRSEYCAAAYPQWRADGSNSGTAGAFLFPWFLAAAANKASGLCGMCAKAFISHLANHCLMNNSFVIVYAKDAVIQLYFAGFLAGDIIQLYFRH